ncbi:MAG: hypothetical protein HZA34_03655 [Candidatus Pacebacteria bacterium]|nr:hypothetical protein [Candidatus Paceibacterota bacterium]
MALPNVFGTKKSSDLKRMLALDIGYEVVTAAVWELQDGHAKVIKTSSPIEWHEERVEELTEASDVAFEELGKESVEIDEVLLGLQEEWVEGAHIKEDRKKYLRGLKDQLALKPIGFVVTHEALSTYLQELEGGPVNALLVEYTTAVIAVCIVRAKTKTPVVVVGRSGESIADLSEALTRIKENQYPARIIVYSARMKQEELDKEKQTLLAHDWQKVFPFQHIPKVETLPHNVVISAVCLAGGGGTSQMAEATQGETQPLFVDQEVHQNVQDVSTDFGFQEVQMDNLKSEQIGMQTETEQEEMNRDEEESVVSPSRKQFSFSPMPFFHALKTPVQKMWNSLSAGQTLSAKFHSDVRGTKTLRILSVCVVVALLGGTVFGWWYLSTTMTAQVILSLKTQPFAQDVEITLDSSLKQSDPEGGILKVDRVEKEVEGERETNTTGIKIVGDRAKGKVTLFNATSGEKTFPAGTILQGPNNLKFTLDEKVVVASSGGSAQSLQPGTASANATASNIGTESNVSEKTEFLIANFDKKSYVAVSDGAFTGGSSREIQAVAKEDQAKLEQLLMKDLQKRAIDALQQEQKDGTKIIPIGDVAVKTKIFDAKVGEEAKLVNLKLTVTAHALRYTTADLLPVAQYMLRSSLPSTMVLREEKTQIDPQEIQDTTETSVKLKATLSSEGIPTVDRSAIVQSIQGKTTAQATSILKERSEIGESVIRITPSFAGLLFGSLPESAANIQIQTKVGL